MPPDSRAPASDTRTPGGRGPADNPKTRLHKCPRDGCDEQIRADRLMCLADWAAVPKPLKDDVWRTWNRGRGAGTPQHTQAIAAAINAVNRSVAR